MKLFNEDETWTDEGLREVQAFERIVEEFMGSNPDLQGLRTRATSYKIRELQHVMESAVSTQCLSAIMRKRLS